MMTYKSRFKEEAIRNLCDVLLGSKPFINLKVREQVISDILDALEVGNLNDKTLNQIIYKWNEKVK